MCDRYNIKTGLSEIVAPSILAVSRATACTFNCRFIFRFSGVDSKGNQVGAIERYDIRRNAWEMINPTFAIGIPPNILTVRNIVDTELFMEAIMPGSANQPTRNSVYLR